MLLLKIRVRFQTALFFWSLRLCSTTFHRVEVSSPAALVAGQGLTCRDAAAFGANVAVVVD